MCGRFVRTSPVEILRDEFLVDTVAEIDLRPRYNVCPGEDVVAVVANEAGRRLGKLRWGLDRQINVRSESADRRPRFAELLRRRRCLIVADGFYEWQSVGARKVPYFVRPRSGRPFGLAGVWDWRRGLGEAPVAACVILTCPPNDLVAPIHPRMPVILASERAAAWLDPGLLDPRELTPLFRPFPSASLEVERVSSLVSTPRNDSPECIRPVALIQRG